ncbi:hypothetical protein J4573_09570 [Actinomadura barringtoniae]|uniref:Lipoprotein n=1 Tax=Actinomadura barringtoniae TaxID=1427535 RepID=A0A939PC36_9ACTN|nr:hypothetical protein [Actinomadura barringtoniae]
MLRAGALAVVLAVSLSGCEMMTRISDGAYRTAVTDGSIRELQERGIKLDGRPSCTSPKAQSGSVVVIDCTGRTIGGEPVEVTGTTADAGSDHPRERYVIMVGGRQVVDKTCLGRGCPS